MARQSGGLTVSVNRDALIAEIKDNRDNHRIVFEKAIEGYRAFVTQELEKKIERLKKNKSIQAYFQYAIPEDHTSDYDRVISMLQMHTEDTIEIPESDYAKYVMDDWEWTDTFNTVSGTYIN